MSLGFAMSAVYFTTKDAVSLCSFFRPGILFFPFCLVSRHESGGLVLASGCKIKFRIYSSAVFRICSSAVHLTKDVNGG